MKKQSIWVIVIFLFLLGTLASPPKSLSQVSTGTFTGTVTDPSGAPVAGAVVTVTQVAQNLSKTLTTNNYGIYEVKFLPIGGYRVTAEHAGFKKAIQEGLDLNVGQVMRIDFTFIVAPQRKALRSQRMLRKTSRRRLPTLDKLSTEGRSPTCLLTAATLQT